MKPKKCKQCGELFERNPLYPFAVVCSPYCAVGYARKQNEKAIAKKKREFKQNDKKHLINVARDTFNKYIRLRDKDEPCISCGYISERFRIEELSRKPDPILPKKGATRR